MLEALAKIAGLESTYLTVFDWARREQEVRFVFSTGEMQIVEGHRIPLPKGTLQETLPGVTRSPQTVSRTQPDSLVARRLGLKAFVSVPVTVAKHRLFGMLCGASKETREISEAVVGVFESFAGIMAEHFVHLQMEMTEDRAAEAESRLLSRAHFLAEAEHRMKTALTVLQGTALTLRDRRAELPDATRIEFEQSMVRNVLFLARELDGLLIEARADVGSRELSPVDTDVGALIAEIATAFDGLDAEHHVVVDLAQPLRAVIDRAAMHQVLGHLIDNAIKYSPSGGRITIRASDASDSISIDVVDEGAGLPPAVDVFEPFRRGEPDDRRTQTQGVGLGLHIVRNLVEAMGGTVTARNNPDRGSTFAVALPTGAGREHVSKPPTREGATITLE